MAQQFASDYIDVATRLIEFRKAHPEGSLQPADPSQPFQVVEIGGKQRIVVVAAAYRTPDDPRPGIGMAYEEVPGKTPYTRDSELQNAETSAWGRAIVAALAADTKKGIASAEDVRNRQADRDVAVEKPGQPAKKAERQSKAGPPAADPWKGSDPVAVQEWKEVVAAASDKDALAVAWADLNALCSTEQISAADRPGLIDLWNARKAEVLTEGAS